MKVRSLQKDKLINDLENGQMPFARNVIKSAKYDSVTNEDGFTEIELYSKLTVGFISTNKEDVSFLGTGATSEIGVTRNGTYTKILLDAGLNFKLDYPIDGTFYYNPKGELIVIWWESVGALANKPRILNIDCLPFLVDGDKELINSGDIILLDLQPDNPSGVLDIEIRDTGNIECGTYLACFAYNLIESGTTNYSHPSAPIYINDDSSKLNFEDIDGCKGGDIVQKSFKLKWTGLSESYRSISVILIKSLNKIQSAVYIGDALIGDTGEAQIIYSNKNTAIAVPLEEVLIDSPIYVKAHTGDILDNVLHLSNTIIQQVPDIQAYVNNIDVEWVLDNGGSLTDFETSNKDGEYTFFNKGFKSGETYALYFVCKIKDRGLVAYHIPAKGASGSSRSIDISGTDFGPGIDLADVKSTIAPTVDDNVEEGLLVNPDARVFHIFNTAQSDGKMGVWINKDEVYPSTDCWLVKDNLGAQVDDYRGFAVTHHTFPSWQKLIDFNAANNLYDVNASSKLTLIASAIADSDTDGVFPASTLSFATTTNLSGSWNVTGNEFTADEDMNVYLRVLYMLISSGGDTSPEMTIQIKRLVDGVVAETIIHKYFDGSTTAFPYDEEHLELKINKGETIQFIFVPTSATLKGRVELLFINKQISDNDIEGKKLGLKLSNVFIPVADRPNIEYWYLGYAERQNINITRLGQTILVPDIRRIYPISDSTDAILNQYVLDWRGYSNVETVNYRTHNFDSLYFKSFANVDFISANLEIGTLNTYDYHNLITVFANSGQLIKSIKDSYYVPEDVASENNRIGEEFLRLRFNNEDDFGLGKYQFIQADLCFFKENLFLDFTNQNVILVNPGYAPIEIESDNLFEGDTFLCLSGFATSYIGSKAPATQSYYLTGLGDKIGIGDKLLDNFLYVTESTTNVGFRYKDESDDNRYYPKYISVQETAAHLQTDEEKAAYEIGKISPGLIYNEDFHMINNVKSIEVFKCKDECESDIFEFPKRIVRFPSINDESITYRWRRIRPNDYYDGMPGDRGAVWVIKAFNRSLVIQMEEGLYMANPKDIIRSNELEAYLGSGDLFDRLPEEMIPDDRGYVGCRNKWAVLVCKHGYVVWDGVQGKIFVISGSIQEISNEGMRNYLRVNSSYSDIATIDNPFGGNALKIGFDEQNNRLLITKTVLDETLRISTTLSFTFSYSFDDKGWTCNHDYYPTVYSHNRRGIFSILNDLVGLTSKLWQHNTGSPVTFYGTKFAAWIDVAFNNRDSVDKLWESIQWVTEVFNSNNVIYEDTITHIVVYTNHHLTGLIALVKESGLVKSVDNSRKKGYIWSFNKLRDNITDKNVAPINSDGNINSGNLSANLPFFRKNYFINPFIIVRFYIGTTVTNKVHITEVFANYTEK